MRRRFVLLLPWQREGVRRVVCFCLAVELARLTALSPKKPSLRRQPSCHTEDSGQSPDAYFALTRTWSNGEFSCLVLLSCYAAWRRFFCAQCSAIGAVGEQKEDSESPDSTVPVPWPHRLPCSEHPRHWRQLTKVDLSQVPE